MTRLGPFGDGVLGPDAELAPVDFPSSINRDWHCRNGVAVATSITDESIRTMQHVYAYRRKQLFLWSDNLSTIGIAGSYFGGNSAPVGSAENWWAFHCHTGYGAQEIVFHALLWPPDATATSANPTIRFQVFDSAGVSLGYTGYAYGPRGDSYGAINPDDLTVAQVRYSCDENTTYSFQMEVGYRIRVCGLSVWEERSKILVPGSDGLAVDTTAYKQGIFADDYRDLVQQGNRLRTKNGTTLFNFTRETNAASAKELTTTTYTNIIDGSTSAGGIGFSYDLTNANTISGRGVGVRFAVLGSKSADVGDNSDSIRLIDSSGTELAEVSGFSSTASWKTDEFFLTDLDGPLEVQGRTNGTVNSQVHAVNVYTYEDNAFYGDLPSEKSDMFLIDQIDVVTSGAGTGELNGPVASMTFGTAANGGQGAKLTPLLGNSDGFYRLRLRIARDASGSTFWFTLKINGTDVGSNSKSLSRLVIRSTGSDSTTVSTAEFGFIALGGSTDDVMDLTVDFVPKYDSTYGAFRAMYARGSVSRSTDNYSLESSAFWGTDTDEVVAITIESSDGGSRIQAGSQARLYRVNGELT